MAQESALNAQFPDCQSPELIKYFADMGVKCVHHDYEGENWVSCVPIDAIGKEEKLPCVAIFGEMGLFNSSGVVSIFGAFFEYIRLAAQGQLIAVFFALESADDNDMLNPILQQAAKLYPIDKSRIYLTGHSHNGRYVQEFMRRHQMQLAGVAPLSNEPGQGKNISDGQIALEASVDMPFIMISGINEVYGMFPLHSAPQNVTEDTLQGDLETAEADKRILSWQRRLESARCPVKSYDDIAATRHSYNIVERKLGIPIDRSEVIFLDGFENYVADIKNVDGKYHLRIIGQENSPHCVQPSKITLSWDYLRRFARNQQTGEIIERY